MNGGNKPHVFGPMRTKDTHSKNIWSLLEIAQTRARDRADTCPHMILGAGSSLSRILVHFEMDYDYYDQRHRKNKKFKKYGTL
jgi:hypothetical protein